MCHVSGSNDSCKEMLGEVDLHDFGQWKEHRMEDGDQIIGIYGLQNNLIRGIGFILMNMRPPTGFFERLKQSISCTKADSKLILEPREKVDEEEAPNLVSDDNERGSDAA